MTAMLIGSAANLIFDSYIWRRDFLVRRRPPPVSGGCGEEALTRRPPRICEPTANGSRRGWGKGAPGDFGPNPLEEAEIWFNLTLLDVMDQNISAGC